MQFAQHSPGKKSGRKKLHRLPRMLVTGVRWEESDLREVSLVSWWTVDSSDVERVYKKLKISKKHYEFEFKRDGECELQLFRTSMNNNIRG